MKRYKIVINLLALIGLGSGNYLAYSYSFKQIEIILVNLFIVILYFFSRVTIARGERRLSSLNKEYERLHLIYETEHRDTEILHILDEISASFMANKHLRKVFEHTLDGVQQVLNAKIVLLEIITEKGSVPTTKVVRGHKDLILNDNIYMKVIVQGSSVLINNLSSYHTEYRRYKSLADQGISSFLIAPLKLTKEPIGLLGIFTKKPFDFTGEELRLLTTFTTHASLIIENARLLETTRRLSITDELTQLYNFRHFQNRFENEFQRAKRYKHNLSVLMCDIDNFKNYNDTNGHEAGNEILKKVAQIMKNSARDVDLIARFGGEEFVLVLIETAKDNAHLFAERLREAIEKENFPHQEKQPTGNLTITIGVAGFPEDVSTARELRERADEALYQGKREGRNRVVTYEKK